MCTTEVVEDRTLFGYDRLAKSMHKGNVGIRTGSTPRAAGKDHLFDSATGRTACGRERNQMVVTRIPAWVNEENWISRIGLCRTCRAHAGI